MRCLILLALLFSLTACDKQPLVPVTRAASVSEAVVALPNFTELVKREGPAVVNISTTRRIRGGRAVFPEFMPDDPFYEFFRRFSPAEPHEYNSQSRILQNSVAE